MQDPNVNDEQCKSCKYNLSVLAVYKRTNGTAPKELLTDVYYGASSLLESLQLADNKE